MTKIVLPPEHRGLVVGNTESRKVTLTLTVEAACVKSPVTGKMTVERARDARGRWVPAKTFAARCEALGLELTDLSIGEPGSHTPNY